MEKQQNLTKFNDSLNAFFLSRLVIVDKTISDFLKMLVNEPSFMELVKESAKKAEAKKENVKMIRVTLVKSTIGYNGDQARTCKALGLGKLNSSHDLPDNACVRGMIFKVKHLVKVEELN